MGCPWSGSPEPAATLGPTVSTAPTCSSAVCARSVHGGHRHFLLGGHPGVPERVKAALEQAHPGVQIVGTLSPPFGPAGEDAVEAVLAAINAAAPDIVWVALGSPRQERWMAQHQGDLDASVLIGVGAAFDFLAGRKPHAPRWIQRSGFEWLFRLATEPRRLWRRYLRYPLFAVLFLAQLIGLKRYDEAFEEQGASGVDGDGTAPATPGDQVPQADVFGVQISALNIADLHQIIAAAVDTKTRALLPNVNAHALNLAYEAPWLRDFFNQSTAVFPDGSGALFAARVQGRRFARGASPTPTGCGIWPVSALKGVSACTFSGAEKRWPPRRPSVFATGFPTCA